MTKTKIKQLEKELKNMTADRDTCMWMYKNFLEVAQDRGKAVNVLTDMINKEQLISALAELYDFKQNKTYSTEELAEKVKQTVRKNKKFKKENEAADLD